ncbi:mycothiol synthase [Longispora sp. NPDC051575]|uniref:mycothiol synthase n=1 Tax=Longispora sp. NPDC051575 TaxID=3154943 RepID=UPI003443E6D4
MIVVTREARLTPDQVDEVLALASTAGNTDGAYPLSEHVVLQIKSGAPGQHALVRAGADLAGYAHVDTSDPVDGPAAELVVHPQHRRRGHGRRLVDAVVAIAEEADPKGRLRLWAHGDHPSASALAIRLGFARYRSLWQMRRSLYAPIEAPQLPEGVELRAFEPGRDEDAWLRVNARAFAHHPEQGKLTRADLDLRMAEPWFSPAGFLLAVRGGELLAYHWTKVHTDGKEPIGEVYVVGVDPDAQGLGLGRAVTVAGLRHLRDLGLSQTMLYVDEDNPNAVKLYEKLGFSRWTVDVGFQRITNT